MKGPSVYGQLACGFHLILCLLPKETLLLVGVDFTLMIRRCVFVSVLFLTFGKVKVPCFLIQLVHKATISGHTEVWWGSNWAHRLPSSWEAGHEPSAWLAASWLEISQYTPLTSLDDPGETLLSSFSYPKKRYSLEQILGFSSPHFPKFCCSAFLFRGGKLYWEGKILPLEFPLFSDFLRQVLSLQSWLHFSLEITKALVVSTHPFWGEVC